MTIKDNCFYGAAITKHMTGCPCTNTSATLKVNGTRFIVNCILERLGNVSVLDKSGERPLR